ncbi:hypothetical protein D2C55_20235 [Escherichia coli]|nr:hypothetical protein [Escherichia coli]
MIILLGVEKSVERRHLFSDYSNSVTKHPKICRLMKFQNSGNDSNLLIVFYVQIMPDDFVMQLHRF